MSSSRSRAVLARRRQGRPQVGARRTADRASGTPAEVPRQDVVPARRRRGPRGLTISHRLGLILFALLVVCVVVGLSFLVGYIVGKVFL